jgi:hypothetical protein
VTGHGDADKAAPYPVDLVAHEVSSTNQRSPGEWRQTLAASAGSGVNRLHPPEDGDVVDLDSAFDQQLLHVAVGQAVTQVPADRDHDHLSREPEPGERRPRWQPEARTR